MNTFALFAVLTLLPGQIGSGRITGTAVNGSQSRKAMAGAEVVLVATVKGSRIPVARTTTDAQGHYVFADLPVDGDLTYLPGVNHQGIHYPGPRIRLDARTPQAKANLIGYDAVASPCPLICERHQLQLRTLKGAIEVREVLDIQNPSRTSYVGEAIEEHRPVTLRLSLPAGFDTVTFDKEFNGRNFRIENGFLATDLPWPPGKRQIAFTYRLPAEATYALYTRILDLPTERLSMHIGHAAGEIHTALPFVATDHDGLTFQNREPLQAGYALTVEIGSLPIAWDTIARWSALGVLILLVAGTMTVTAVQKRAAATASGIVTRPGELATVATGGKRSGRQHRRAS